jgi:hypothetical protein
MTVKKMMSKKKNKKVLCFELTVELIGPADATAKRIRWVKDILLSSIRDLEMGFRRSKFPQMKGFSLRHQR